jgi:zinc/manganese transport system substrate-binding protein
MFFRILISFLFVFSNCFAQDILTTLPEFAWASEKLVPDARIISLLNGTEDPHFVDASPSFIFKVAKAKVVIFNGMQLEIGWLPKILEMSGNNKIQMGSPGFCDASIGVKKVEQLTNYDRSMGDIHPAGNPHYTLSIPRMIESLLTIKKCLEKNGYDAKTLNTNYELTKVEMLNSFKKNKGILKKRKFYVYHREFSYFADDYKLNLIRSLEKVPGVLPSASFLTKMAVKAKDDKPLAVLAGATSPRKILSKFEELSKIPYLLLPLHPKRGEDYLEFMEKNIIKIKSLK